MTCVCVCCHASRPPLCRTVFIGIPGGHSVSGQRRHCGSTFACVKSVGVNEKIASLNRLVVTLNFILGGELPNVSTLMAYLEAHSIIFASVY